MANVTDDPVIHQSLRSFDWAEDVDMTITPIPVAFVAPAACAPCNFSGLHSNNQNSWGSLSYHHHHSQPCTCNPFCSCKYMTNQGYNPTAPPPPPVPIQLVKTVRHPHGIVPSKPVIKTISPASIPHMHPSTSTSSCEPISAVHLDSPLRPTCALLLDWSGDPLLLARIL